MFDSFAECLSHLDSKAVEAPWAVQYNSLRIRPRDDLDGGVDVGLQVLESLHILSGVPVEELLAVEHVCEVAVFTRFPEGPFLQQVQKVQTLGETEELSHQELGVLRLLPVLQIVQVRYEVRLVEVPLCSEVCLGLTVQIAHVTEALHELKLHLEAQELLLLVDDDGV